MTPEQTQLARQRLWLGITNVGFWVLAASGGLLWLRHCGTKSLDGRWYATIGVAAIAAQAVFDFTGGVWLMPAPRPEAASFLPRWARGVLGHTLVLAGVGVLSLTSFRFTSGFGAAILFATMGLALGRRWLLRVIGGVSFAEIEHGGEYFLSAGAVDPAFTGGIVGFGRTAASLLPTNWLQSLPQGDLEVEISRRRWQIAHAPPGKALLLILGGNLLGALFGSILFKWGERTPAEALFGHACWMTLWAFGGLLVLPALSRKAVFAADRAADAAGHDPRGWIARFPGVVGEDGGANRAVQTIFYPIPSAELRLRGLTSPPIGGFIPSNLARSNLYYSWATLTLLGRAVHCNAGRPALWVFPPSA